MRIYNATKAQIEMPLSNGTKLVIPGNSISGEFMPNSTIISVFMTSYTPKQIAFVISGPFEISMLSNFAGSGDYVVSSLEAAVARFAPVTMTTTTPVPEPELIPVVPQEPEKKEELEEKVEEEPAVVTTTTPAPKPTEKKKPTPRKNNTAE